MFTFQIHAFPAQNALLINNHNLLFLLLSITWNKLSLSAKLWLVYTSIMTNNSMSVSPQKTYFMLLRISFLFWFYIQMCLKFNVVFMSDISRLVALAAWQELSLWVSLHRTPICTEEFFCQISFIQIYIILINDIILQFSANCTFYLRTCFPIHFL